MSGAGVVGHTPGRASEVIHPQTQLGPEGLSLICGLIPWWSYNAGFIEKQ